MIKITACVFPGDYTLDLLTLLQPAYDIVMCAIYLFLQLDCKFYENMYIHFYISSV